MKNLNNSGFSPVYVVLATVVVGVVGFAGWRVYDSISTKTSDTVSNAPQENNAAVTPINSAADLNKAVQNLDSANIDSDLNSAEIEKDLNTIL